MDRRQALVIIGAIPLEDPVHPHMSMSKENQAKVNEAYKVIERDLIILSKIEAELEGYGSRGGRIGGWPLFSNLIKIVKGTD